MARKVWVTKRQPDLFTVMSTRRGQRQLALVLGTSTAVLKLAELWLIINPDQFGIYQMGASLLAWLSNITLGATICLPKCQFKLEKG